MVLINAFSQSEEPRSAEAGGGSMGCRGWRGRLVSMFAARPLAGTPFALPVADSWWGMKALKSACFSASRKNHRNASRAGPTTEGARCDSWEARCYLTNSTVAGACLVLHNRRKVRISRVCDDFTTGDRFESAKAAFQPGKLTGCWEFIHVWPVCD